MYTTHSLSRRIIALVLVIIFASVGLVARLFYIQIVQGRNLQSRALDQWMRDLPLTAQRGSITDRNGVVLASSYSVYDVYVKPVLVEDVDRDSQIYSLVLKLDLNETKEKISNRNISEVLIAKRVEKSKIDELLTFGIKSFVATENWERYYEYGDYLSQILGFVSADGVGQAGIELFYNTYLAGFDGISLIESDAKGSETKSSTSYYIPSIAGLSVALTIDFAIQAEVEKIISDVCLQTGAKSATAIVMDPNTGELLAITTKPSMSLNSIDRDDLETLYSLTRSFAISDSYEPGSTFKAITAAIAIDCGVSSPSHMYYCPGYRIIDGVRVNCHKKTGHGSQSLTQGLCNSCNCVFMEVINNVGKERFFKYVDRFHFGNTLGIDFPSESTGIVIDKNLMTMNDFLRNGFGQSISVSALQLASAVSSIITDGYLKKPYLVSKIVNSEGSEVFSQTPTILNKVVEKSVTTQINYMLEKVVNGGGGKMAYLPGYSIAGKTGTAQKYDSNGRIAEGKYIASFFGYAPHDVPQFFVSVLIDEPKSSIYGNVIAAPCVKDIFQKIFEIRKILPNGEVDEREEFELPELVGMTMTEAGAILASLELYYVTEGEGDRVLFVAPTAGTMVKRGDVILLKF